MRTLAVMAHYDSQAQLAPHAARNLAALASDLDQVIVVSTAGMAPPAEFTELPNVQWINRANFGYDFYSYRHGLESADLSGFDQVVICNDSYVGPLIPYRDIFARMQNAPYDFWGMTQTTRRAHHVQSFFVTFRSWVATSPTFTRFWRDMTPLSDRSAVIIRYEIGLSATLAEAGFRLGSYFVENAADRRLARARHLWWSSQRIRALPLSQRPSARKLLTEPWNPMAALADRALPDGHTGQSRLPMVKIDTLRYDPYGLDSDGFLNACERHFPESFAGVRDYLDRTAQHYPRREGEPAFMPPPGVLRPTLGYTA